MSYTGAHSNFSLRLALLCGRPLVDDDYPVSFEQRNLAITGWLWHVSSMVLSRGLGSSNNNANNITIIFIS